MDTLELKRNYISRAVLEKFINEELEMIKKNKGKMNDALLGGLEAAYRCTLEVIRNECNV